MDQLSEIPPGVLIAGKVHLLKYFVVLKLNNRCVLISISMVFGKDSKSLLWAVMVDQPSRRLREKQDEHHNHDRETSLDEGGDSPGPGSCVVLVGAIGSPPRKDTAKPPEVVVHTSHRTTIGWVGQLDGISRSSSRGEGCAEA